MNQGRLFVISGASGVGKSTVLSHVMAACFCHYPPAQTQ